MRIRQAVIMTIIGAFGAGAAGAQPVEVKLDQETTLNGVDVACTGIGQTKDDPKWKAYPVRLEFATAEHTYLAGEEVTVSNAKGQPQLDLTCDGPWVLMKLPVGVAYRVDAKLTDQTAAPRSGTVKAPKNGQARFVLTFPDAH
jgi:hypothetical protein